MTHSLPDATTRYVSASRQRSQLRGSAEAPAARFGLNTGTLFKLDQVDLASALSAFQAALTDAGPFSIVTRDGSRADFSFGHGPRPWFISRLFRWPVKQITLDIWFEEEPESRRADARAIPAAVARGFIRAVYYRDVSDAELWRELAVPEVAA